MKVPAAPAGKSRTPAQTDTIRRHGILIKTTPSDRGLVEPLIGDQKDLVTRLGH